MNFLIKGFKHVVLETSEVAVKGHTILGVIMKDELMTFRVNFNSVEPITFTKFENGRMYTYGYSIERDRNGVEVSRTEPVSFGSIGYDNGKPFTKAEYNRIMRSGS